MERMTRFIVLTSLLLLMLAACGDEYHATRLYEQEQLLFEAQRYAEKLSIDPAGADSAERMAVAAAFLGVAEHHFADPRRGRDPDQRRRDAAQYIAMRSLFDVARLQRSAGARTDAVATLERLRAEFPDAPRARFTAAFEKARILEELSRWDEAFAIYGRLLHTYRPDGDTISARDLEWMAIPLSAHRLYQQLDADAISAAWLDTGIVFLSGLVEERPGSALALMAKGQLANFYELQERWDDALDTYRTIRDTLGRQLPKARISMADILWQHRKDHVQAESIYREVIGIDTIGRFRLEAETKLASLLVDGRRFDEARNLLRESKSRAEREGRMVLASQMILARSYEEEGRWDRALTEYRWLMENFPDAPGSQQTELHIIHTLLQNGDSSLAREWHDDAATRLARTIELNRTNENGARATLQLARVHVAHRDFDAAAQTYRRLLEQYPPTLARVQAYIEYSVVEADERNDPEAATTVLQALLKTYPNLPIRARIEDRIAHLESLIKLQEPS